MADAIELSTAFVSIVPSMQGSQGAIASAIVPEAEGAGDEAGGKFGDKFKGSMGRVLGGAALFAGVVASAKGLYEIGAVFDDVADTIRIGTGATGDALDDLVQSAKNVGSTVPVAFEDIGPVVADVNTRLGLTGDTLETVASQYLQAGNILGETVDIEKTSAAFSAFKIEGDDVVSAMDHLFQVSQATGVGMNELAAAAQASGPAMTALGFSFEETTALAGSLDKAGLNSTGTLAAMSKGLVTLAKDGEEPQEAFRRVTGELDGLIKSGDTAAAIDLASGIFGSKAAVGFVGAVESGTLALDDLVAGTGATSDTILGVADDTADFAEKWQLLKNKATLALEPLGSKVFNMLGDAISFAMPYFDGLASWLENNSWALTALVGVIGVGLVGAFAALVAPIVATTVAMLANPITWIVLGVVALIAAIVALAMNWDTIAAWISKTWGDFTTWLGESLSGIGGWFADAWDSIIAFIVEWGPRFLIAIGGPFVWLAAFLITNWDGIYQGAKNGLTAVIDWVKKIPGWLADAFLNFTLPGLLIKHWDGIYTSAKDKLGSLIDWVGGVPKSILDKLGDTGTLLKDAGKQIITGFLGGLTAKFEDVKKWVGGVGSWIADHKGPKAYDLALLRPAGGWIMTGLQDSMEDQIPSLRRTLGKVTDAITLNAGVRAPNFGPNYAGAAMANTFSAPATAASGGLHIATLNTGADAGEIFDELEWRERTATL